MAPKEDLGTSTAELVYDGDFVSDMEPKPTLYQLEQQRQQVGDPDPYQQLLKERDMSEYTCQTHYKR